MMYAIVKNVVTPAITSVLKSVLCFLYSKYLSNINPPSCLIIIRFSRVILFKMRGYSHNSTKKFIFIAELYCYS